MTCDGSLNRELEDVGGLDFEDMLVQAAEHVEQGRCKRSSASRLFGQIRDPIANIV